MFNNIYKKRSKSLKEKYVGNFRSKPKRNDRYRNGQNYFIFPSAKNKRTSLKKRQKTSVDALVTKNLEKKIKFEKEPKLDSKSPFFKDKNAKDKTNMKRYSSTKEASRIKRKSSKLRNTENIAYRETQVDLKSPEEKPGQKKFDDFELNELPYE